MTDVPVIAVGLLGVGTVGSAVAQHLIERRDLLIERTGCEFRLMRALVRDVNKPRPYELSRDTLTADPAEVVDNPEIDAVIEAMGGENPAFDYLSRALQTGKRVATANKEVIARRGPELQRIADRNAGRLRFEASVGGGIPLMAALRHLLPVNRITSIRAIVNGTTNYMLSEMGRIGAGYAAALAEAQRLGFAEPDPTADVEGIDAGFKLAILASLGFGVAIDPEQIFKLGITRIDAADIAHAQANHQRIKLIASARRNVDTLELSVAPTLLPLADPLATVDGALNGIEIGCDLAGPIRLVGAGAGPGPTASALIGDVVRAFREAGGLTYPARPSAAVAVAGPTSPAYVRLAADSPVKARRAATQVFPAESGARVDATTPGVVYLPATPIAALRDRLAQPDVIKPALGATLLLGSTP